MHAHPASHGIRVNDSSLNAQSLRANNIIFNGQGSYRLMLSASGSIYSTYYVQYTPVYFMCGLQRKLGYTLKLRDLRTLNNFFKG